MTHKSDSAVPSGRRPLRVLTVLVLGAALALPPLAANQVGGASGNAQLSVHGQSHTMPLGACAFCWTKHQP
jgi:hypothetical protein